MRFIRITLSIFLDRRRLADIFLLFIPISFSSISNALEIVVKSSALQFIIFKILEYFVVKEENLCYNKHVGSLAKLVRQVTATH